MTDRVQVKKRIFGGYSISYDCPHCSAGLKSPIDDAGKTDSCPECGRQLDVPGVAEREKIRETDVLAAEARRKSNAERAERRKNRKLLLRAEVDALFMRIPWKTIGVVAVLVALPTVYWMFFTSPFTVVNAGDGKVYKVNKRTGESWLLSGNREIPISDITNFDEKRRADERIRADEERRAIEWAQRDDSLKMWFSSSWQSYDRNNWYIQRMLEANSEIDIHGWKAERIGDDKYLVGCTYDYKGQNRGFYFEVNLNTYTVRNIFANTTLAKRYKDYDIHPTYRIVEDNDPPWPNDSKIRFDRIEAVE